MSHRVTESLRRQWSNQRVQLAEELAIGEYQDGQPITAEGRAEFEREIASMDKLLSFPVGTKFENAQELRSRPTP